MMYFYKGGSLNVSVFYFLFIIKSKFYNSSNMITFPLHSLPLIVLPIASIRRGLFCLLNVKVVNESIDLNFIKMLYNELPLPFVYSMEYSEFYVCIEMMPSRKT